MSVYVIPKTITAMYINTDYISQPIVGRFDKRVKSSHACEGLIATVRNLVDGNGCSNVVKNVQWRCMIYQRQSQPCTLTRTTFSHPKTPVDIQSPTSLHVPSTPPPRLIYGTDYDKRSQQRSMGPQYCLWRRPGLLEWGAQPCLRVAHESSCRLLGSG